MSVEGPASARGRMLEGSATGFGALSKLFVVALESNMSSTSCSSLVVIRRENQHIRPHFVNQGAIGSSLLGEAECHVLVRASGTVLRRIYSSRSMLTVRSRSMFLK